MTAPSALSLVTALARGHQIGSPICATFGKCNHVIFGECFGRQFAMAISAPPAVVGNPREPLLNRVFAADRQQPVSSLLKVRAQNFWMRLIVSASSLSRLIRASCSLLFGRPVLFCQAFLTKSFANNWRLAAPQAESSRDQALTPFGLIVPALLAVSLPTGRTEPALGISTAANTQMLNRASGVQLPLHFLVVRKTRLAESAALYHGSTLNAPIVAKPFQAPRAFPRISSSVSRHLLRLRLRQVEGQVEVNSATDQLRVAKSRVFRQLLECANLRSGQEHVDSLHTYNIHTVAMAVKA